MLKIELNGRAVSSADNKQTLRINDIPVEVERIGNSIYVNKEAINVVIVEKKRSIAKTAITFVAGAGAVAAFALAAANYDVVIQLFDSAVEFTQPYVSSAYETVVDTAEGVFGNGEHATAEPTPAE
jgi:hypothetical protein